MRNKSFIAVLVVVVLFAALNLRDLAGLAGISLPRFPMPYGRSSVDNLLAVLAVVVAALVLARRKRWAVARNLGLSWAAGRGPLLVLLATVPCWIGLGYVGKFSHDFTARDLLFTALLFPLAEEIVFRGFGFVFTRKNLGWPLVAAIFVQAIAFGFIHWLSFGGGTGVALQIFAITFFGAVGFALLDGLGGYTIWNGLALHISLNAAWTVFAVSDSAASGVLGNSLRIASVLLAIALVYAFARRGKFG